MLLKDEEGRFVWKPTLKQEKFLSVPLSVKEAFYAGALMAGKSDVLLMYPLVHGWHNHPEFKGLYLRRTFPELKNEIIPRAKSYFRPFGGVFNKTDSCFTFPSGALYFFGHCEHEDDVHNYDTMQPNYAAFDELTSFTEWQYLYITIERVRVSESLKHELPMIVRAASNPGNVGHQFVYKRFIKPNKSGSKILIGPGGLKRIFIPATIDDNPYASEQYKQELDSLPEAEKRAKKFGDWEAYEGQVFDELRDKRYPGEPENAYHLVEPFEIPNWWPKLVAIDWGFSALTSVGYAAISPDKRIYIYRHQTFQKLKIEEWTPLVKYYLDIERPEDIVICHSAGQHRSEPHTILEQVIDGLNHSVRLGEKDRIGGKMLIHEYLRWKIKPVFNNSQSDNKYDHEHAMFLFRNKGLEYYKQYLESFQEVEPEKNLPKLLFFNEPSVKIIIDTLKSCSYEKSKADGVRPEDVAEFNGDDPYDMLRMLLRIADQFFGSSSDKSKELEMRSQIINRLEQTQDINSFYRSMRKLDSVNTGLEALKRYPGIKKWHS